MTSSSRIFLRACCLLIAALGVSQAAEAQNRFDALRFSTQYPAGDAANIAGSAAAATYIDYGSVLQNPATLGLAEHSSFNIGLGLRDVSEDADYLGSINSFDDTQTRFTNVGFAYALPTVQGSLVIGGGYNQTMDFNRAYRLNGFNRRSSITDLFFDNSFYFDTAFNAFAIEEDDFGQFPVFRPFPEEPFQGISQTANVVERGQLGEFTLSLGTEFLPGMFVGATLGAPTGSYSYERNFLERDTEGLFGPLETEIDGQAFTIPAPDNVTLEETVDADITGFSARLGLLYEVLPFLNIGASYALPTRYSIDESFSVDIRTQYEDGEAEADGFNGENSYEIKTPSRLILGLATQNLPVNLSVSAERVGYGSIEFRDFGDLDFELQQNEAIREDFDDVINFRAGLSLDILDAAVPRIGYAYLPSASTTNDEPVQFLSGGLRLGVNQNFSLDIALQYAFFDDEQVVYEHFNYERNDGSFRQERVSTSVERFHAVVGANIRF